MESDFRIDDTVFVVDWGDTSIETNIIGTGYPSGSMGRLSA